MRKVVKFDHRKRLQMKLGILAFKRRKEICEITKRQFGVQATCYMQFSSPLAHSLAGNIQAFVNIVGISICLSGSAIEPAKLAVNITNISGIEMTINVEVSPATVALSPYSVGELPQSLHFVCRI